MWQIFKYHHPVSGNDKNHDKKVNIHLPISKNDKKLAKFHFSGTGSTFLKSSKQQNQYNAISI